MSTAAGVATGRDTAVTTFEGSGTHVGSPLQIGVGVGLAMLYLLALGAQLDSVAMAVLLAGAGLSVAWPASGLAMFAVMMPMREPEVLVPIRFNALLVGGITFGCILRLPIDRLPLRIHPAAVLLVGYLLISGLSILPQLNGHPAAWTPSALNALLRLGTGVALLLSASYLFRLMSPWPILVLGLLGATLAALLAIGDILGYLPVPALMQGLVEGTGSSRASGAFADPNFLGLYAATAAVFALGLVPVTPGSLKPLVLALAVLLLVSVALTFSRGAYVGVAVGIVVLVAHRSPPRSIALAVVLIVALVILAVALYPLFLEARQAGPLLPIDEFELARSQESRKALVFAGIAMFAAFPVFGVGFGSFQFVSPSFLAGAAPDSTFSHNQYLNVLAEQGIVGAVIVAALVGMGIVAIIRSGSPLTSAALAMGAAFLGASVFLHSATVFQSASLVWLVLAVTMATGRRPADKLKGS